MTPELWQRAQALFLDALDQPQADRTVWLEQACAFQRSRAFSFLSSVASLAARDLSSTHVKSKKKNSSKNFEGFCLAFPPFEKWKE